MKITRLLLLLLGLSLFGCHKEEYRSDSTGTPVQAVFAGRITDEQGGALEGATVTAGLATAVTDANGVFRLAPASLPSRNAILRIKKAGYFEFARAYAVADNVLQQVSIQLLRRQLAFTFPADQGTQAHAGDTQISFPANAVQNADGSAYSGAVNAYARYIDPTDPNLDRFMPGDLRGIDAQGDTRALATFGMLGIELATPGGDPLQLATGQEAEIKVGIPAALQAAAPAEIPLWYFDLGKARWIEEGSAQKDGNFYRGKVKHFSFWNFDAGFSTIHLSGKTLIGDPQQALGGAVVRLTILSSGYTGFAYTDVDGNFGGNVPRDEAMQLDVFVYDQCGNQSILTQTIGPFAQDADLPPMVIPAGNAHSYVLSGRLVDCNQQPVAHGYVLVSTDNSSLVIPAGSDGTFQKTLVTCSGNSALSLTGFDPGAKTASNLLGFQIPDTSLQTGDIEVCQASAEFATVVFNGVTYSFGAPFYTSYDDSFSTFISGHNGDINFSFAFNGFHQTGNFVLIWLFVSKAGTSLVNTHSGIAAITSYGNMGEPIAGSFNGTAQDSSGNSYPVSVAFQVNRDQ